MKVYSLFQNEITPKRVEIELHTRFQIPSFQILGLPAPEIQEARERIIAAFTACGIEFPKKKVIINLTPSSERKTGTGHDLAIALKILEAQLDIKWPHEIYAWGELGLDGNIKPCAHLAKWIELIFKENIQTLVLCSEDKKRLHLLLAWRKQNGLALPPSLNIITLDSLEQFQEVLSQPTPVLNTHFEHFSDPPPFPANTNGLLPLSPYLERAIQVAMVGRHHLLILGPKGMGKSQALEWMAKISPRSTSIQTWERILQSDNAKDAVNFDLPIRRVHAHLRPTHLLGSWNTHGFQAGELSKAHGGIFIADEFLEWPRDAKECLREPLEQKKYSLIRKQGNISLSCDLQFVGTGNLCPCGGLPPSFKPFVRGATQKKADLPTCRCLSSEVHHYLSKLSGPVADRIDLILIHAEKPTLGKTNFNSLKKVQSIQSSIQNARAFALKQFGALPSELTVSWLEDHLPTSDFAVTVLGNIHSLRSRHKILRMARSIQALEQSEELKIEHLWEAAGFRFEGLPN